ncbi:MAG: acetoacetate--CoA ligase [Coxiellaceae bacterium]|nr:acetoacetate--CoA ligase [Coxiellaceae bacterium]
MTKPLWQPTAEESQNSQMAKFTQFVNQSFDLQLGDYHQLYQWSVDHSDLFWNALVTFCDVKFDQAASTILQNPNKMPGAEWFPGATLNFAQHLLRFNDDRVAIQFANEIGERRSLTYAELNQQVIALAAHLQSLGVVAGDRVAGFVANTPEAIVAMLATTYLGAVWSSCSPDFGLNGVIDRFGQINPKVLFAVDGHYYGRKKFNDLEKVKKIRQQLPALEELIVIPYVDEKPAITGLTNCQLFSDCLTPPDKKPAFVPVKFNDPLYIMYSSGTTGKPKCMVHSVGGTLLQHLKELQLHTDITREDTFFFFTTCGWMMWNWLVSGLALGCTLVLFDGSPFHPTKLALLDLIDEFDISVFGIGAKYIEAIARRHLSPKDSHRLNSLRTILSTGSPLLPESFDYLYEHFPASVQVASISGGSDIVSCFALGCPILPVYRGELQCRGLGLAVDVFNEQGQSIRQQKGELVCTKPFPAMPIYFWNDANGERYHKAYFDRFDNIWAHGDYAEITEHDGVIIYGRSDATLNPSGVRIGTAEIYTQVDQFDQVLDCIAVGQAWRGSERIILFVIMREGCELTKELTTLIKDAIRQNASPHHVPAKIIAVADIPRTISGKAVELAVKKIIHGEEVTNTDSLANPEALNCYVNLKELER